MNVLAICLLGLCAGSFVNALVWRLYKQADGKKRSKADQRKLSIMRGRSMCPHCKHELAWYDLLPVLSWLTLRGKCRYCHRPIDDNPLVEVVMAVVFVGSYLAWPYGFTNGGVVLFVFWLLFLVGFMALAVYDLRWMLLPNKIVYMLIGLVVVQDILKFWLYDASAAFVAPLWGFVIFGGLFYALFQLSQGKWLGGGDVKLAFMMGPLLGGPLDSVLTIFLASIFGTIVALPLMITKRLTPTSRIPFGPFLLFATVIVYLFGGRIADWYVVTFLSS